jgi:hypothetical protein
MPLNRKLEISIATVILDAARNAHGSQGGIDLDLFIDLLALRRSHGKLHRNKTRENHKRWGESWVNDQSMLLELFPSDRGRHCAAFVAKEPHVFAVDFLEPNNPSDPPLRSLGSVSSCLLHGC